MSASPRLPARLVLATGNAGKLREMREILAPWQIDVCAQSDFTATGAEETGLSFVENAILKARHASAAAGLPAIADDSGLEVDALRGAPGIYSARYAGPDATDADNNGKLLEALGSVPHGQRIARYRCAMVYVRWPDDPAPVIAQAAWEGHIGQVPRGTGGFGYDPLFCIDALGSTAAELDPITKNQLSHRGKALRELVSALTSGQSSRC